MKKKIISRQCDDFNIESSYKAFYLAVKILFWVGLNQTSSKSRKKNNNTKLLNKDTCVHGQEIHSKNCSIKTFAQRHRPADRLLRRITDLREFQPLYPARTTLTRDRSCPCEHFWGRQKSVKTGLGRVLLRSNAVL